MPREPEPTVWLGKLGNRYSTVLPEPPLLPSPPRPRVSVVLLASPRL